MKIIIIDCKGRKELEALARETEERLDREHNDPVVYTAVGLSDELALAEMKNGYDEDDYDFFIWGAQGTSDPVGKVKEALGCADADIEHIKHQQ